MYKYGRKSLLNEPKLSAYIISQVDNVLYSHSVFKSDLYKRVKTKYKLDKHIYNPIEQNILELTLTYK